MATEALTSTKKAAAIIVALGAERASEVYKYLSEEEVEQLSLEIAKLDRLSPEEMQSTVEDFYGLCITQKVINEAASSTPRTCWKRPSASSKPPPLWSG